MVVRYHTFPTIQQQTVACHSWQLMRILWAIWPEVPKILLQHTLIHDCGEVERGDVPYPAKKGLSAATQKELENAERSTILSMCGPWRLPPPPAMTDEEKAIFKLAEYIEMIEFAWNEINLGNKYAVLIKKRCEEAIRNMRNLVPPDINANAMNYMEKRATMELEINT